MDAPTYKFFRVRFLHLGLYLILTLGLVQDIVVYVCKQVDPRTTWRNLGLKEKTFLVEMVKITCRKPTGTEPNCFRCTLTRLWQYMANSNAGSRMTGQ